MYRKIYESIRKTIGINHRKIVLLLRKIVKLFKILDKNSIKYKIKNSLIDSKANKLQRKALKLGGPY